MLIGLISDVHSNAVALSSILRDFDCLQVKTILHAGDIIGYNPYPNETIRIFQERNIYSILGNHDRALITGNTQNFHPLALNALKWTSSVISRPERQYLQGLGELPQPKGIEASFDHLQRDLLAQHIPEQERNVMGSALRKSLSQGQPVNPENNVDTDIDFAMKGDTIHSSERVFSTPLSHVHNIAIYFIDGMRVGVVHGSPRDFNEYIYPKDLAASKTMPSFMSAMNCDVLVLGHTHIQFQVEYQEGIVVNPGSVGQPRDGNPGAAFALLNTETRKVTFHRADYDHEKVIGDILKAKLPVPKQLLHMMTICMNNE